MKPLPKPKRTNSWLEHLKKTFKEMREEDPTIQYKDAMKKAKLTYKG